MIELAHVYHRLIDYITVTTGMNDAILHIHAGLAIFLIAYCFSGRAYGAVPAFLIVVACELGNEAVDWLHLGWVDWPDTLSDIANTLFWPALLMVVLCFRASAHANCRPASDTGAGLQLPAGGGSASGRREKSRNRTVAAGMTDFIRSE